MTDPETGKVWKAVPDGSLHGVSAEIVTPMLAYDELPKLQEVVRSLRRTGGRTAPICRARAPSCGTRLSLPQSAQ